MTGLSGWECLYASRYPKEEEEEEDIPICRIDPKYIPTSGGGVVNSSIK